MWNFQVRPPSSTCQRSASMGIASPVLGSRDSRFSYIGLRTTSSAPTYRLGSQRSLPKVATATVSVPSGLAAAAGGGAPATSSAVTRERAAPIGCLMRDPPRASEAWGVQPGDEWDECYYSPTRGARRALMRSWAAVAGLAALLLTAIPVSAQETPRAGGVLKAAMIGEPPTLDAHLTTATITYNVMWHVYETVYALDRNYEPTPM